MNQSSSSAPELEHSYEDLLNLWTSGVRDYNSLLSAYLTANSVFVAAIGFLLSRQPSEKILSVLVMVLAIFGILIILQMAIVLGRFDAEIAFWEWRLRGIERSPGWNRLTLLEDFHRLKHGKEVLKDDRNNPTTFSADWALRVHRQWWALRAVSFPLFFGIIYSLFLLWSTTQLFGWPAGLL